MSVRSSFQVLRQNAYENQACKQTPKFAPMHALYTCGTHCSQCPTCTHSSHPPSVRRPLPAGPPARVVKIPCGLHNMAKHSALWYLVRASAMLVLPLTLPTQSRPLHTQACSHRILTSRCRIFPRPLVETKDLATDESVQTCTMLSLTFTPISLRTVQPQAPRCTVGHRNQLGFATGCCDRRLC